MKNGSDEHIQNTKKLRNDCSEFIRSNLDEFRRDIYNRISEKNPNKENPTNEDCTIFLDECVSKNGKWCGAETLKALTIMLKSNIVVFNEKGNIYFAYQFRPEFDQTLMIAFRITNPLNSDLTNTNRNHYDSVVDVETHTITKVAHDLINKYLKSKALNASEIISID